MKLFLFTLLVLWMLMGAIILHAAQMMGRIHYEDMPAYGLEPDKEVPLHTTACFLFWPHALYMGMKRRCP